MCIEYTHTYIHTHIYMYIYTYIIIVIIIIIICIIQRGKLHVCLQVLVEGLGFEWQ